MKIQDWASRSCFLTFLLCCAMVSVAQTKLEWGDQGNGTYKNPVLNADYSDPDVIRVGDKYYMVASDGKTLVLFSMMTDKHILEGVNMEQDQ